MIDQQNIVIENIPARDISLLSFYSSVLNITCQQVQLFIVLTVSWFKSLTCINHKLCKHTEFLIYLFSCRDLYSIWLQGTHSSTSAIFWTRVVYKVCRQRWAHGALMDRAFYILLLSGFNQQWTVSAHCKVSDSRTWFQLVHTFVLVKTISMSHIAALGNILHPYEKYECWTLKT